MQVCCCFTRTFRRFVIKTITDGEFNVRVFIVLTCCRRARSRSIASFCSIRCCQLTLIRCLCWQFLRSLLPSLHAHTVIEHRATLLSRYFGLYSISFQVQTNDRIVARCFSDALCRRAPTFTSSSWRTWLGCRRARCLLDLILKAPGAPAHRARTRTSLHAVLRFLIPLDRVSRQVLKDGKSTRRKLAAGCKDHDGTLKDLDMAFVVGAPV